MPKQREQTRPSLPRSPRLSEPRHRSASLIPPRYGVDVVDFAARPDPSWVSGAQPGRFPFGDRLAHETGGTIDPHTIPSVVVPGLPDRGVSVGGKVALRPDAPIEVARHELAHSLGADEALADRAERSPSVLRGLSRHAPPIDGWAIGFEFQTAGPKNPKTYSRGTIRAPMLDRERPREYQARVAKLAPVFTEWRKQSNIGDHDRPGYKIKSDDGDMEVETVAFPETKAGREQLQATMATMTQEMATIAQLGFNEDDSIANVAPLDTAMLHGIAHSNRNFAGKPQATAGFKLDKISALIDTLAKRAGRYGWGDYWAVKDRQHPQQKPGLQVISGLNVRVRELNDLSANVLGLLHLLASYTLYGGAMHSPTKYLKNIGNTLMVRNDLGKVFSAYLSDDERLELQGLLEGETGQAKVAALFGAADFDSLRAVKVLPKGVMGGDNVVRQLDLTVGKVFDDLLQGIDAIHRKAPDQSIGKIDEDNKFPGQDNPFDIGASDTADRRKGVLAEIRGLADREPHTKWPTLALMMFDLTAELNEGIVPPRSPQPVAPNSVAQPPPQRQPQPLEQVVDSPKIEVNEFVEFTDAKSKASKARVIRVKPDGVVVNHRNTVMTLSWDGEGWRQPPNA